MKRAPKGGSFLNIESSFLLDHGRDVHLEATAYAGAIHIDEREAAVLSGVKDNGQVEWRIRGGHVRVRFRPPWSLGGLREGDGVAEVQSAPAGIAVLFRRKALAI
jgi:hypothetical protein